MQNDFVKIVHVGEGERGAVFCKIAFKSGKLSITGVIGPKANGDCTGSSGQINDGNWGITQYATAWDKNLEDKFLNVWGKYHLNDMIPGSPAQMQYLEENPVSAIYPESRYEKACAVLTAAGLNPDPGFLHNGKPYSYGHAWLRIDVPDSVVNFLQALPSGDKLLPAAWQ